MTGIENSISCFSTNWRGANVTCAWLFEVLPEVDCSGPAVTSGPSGIQAVVDFVVPRHPKRYLMFPYKLKRLGMVGWEEGGVFGSIYGNIRWAWPMYEEDRRSVVSAAAIHQLRLSDCSIGVPTFYVLFCLMPLQSLSTLDPRYLDRKQMLLYKLRRWEQGWDRFRKLLVFICREC